MKILINNKYFQIQRNNHTKQNSFITKTRNSLITIIFKVMIKTLKLKNQINKLSKMNRKTNK